MRHPDRIPRPPLEHAIAVLAVGIKYSETITADWDADDRDHCRIAVDGAAELAVELLLQALDEGRVRLRGPRRRSA